LEKERDPSSAGSLGGSLGLGSPKAYPTTLNIEDAYEVFAYDLVELIVRERLTSEEELLDLFEREIAGRHGSGLDYNKMLRVVANIKKEMCLSTANMRAASAMPPSPSAHRSPGAWGTHG